MLKQLVNAALVLGIMGAATAIAAETKASRVSVDRVMAEWPQKARLDAERMIARYGMPDRVTETILIWDASSTAQQQAMVDLAGDPPNRAEAGGSASR